MDTFVKKVVLYNEDNITNIQLVDLLLRKIPDVEFVAATEPSHGLSLARELQPTLILLDINMPGMTGYEVLDELRREPNTAKIPVIALTANCTDEDKMRGVAAGFDRYLTKPLNGSAFIALMQQTLQ